MIEENNLKGKVISSLFWKLTERLGSHGVQIVVTIVLSRLLLPSDYGVIAMITVFITLANVFVQSGFNTALIQKKEVDEEDYSSVFFLSLFVALILYLILFFTAPLIANFYNMPSVVPILRVLSIVLFFGAVNSVQTTKVSRSMKFKKFFLSSLISIIISGITGIFMAYKGLGAWALVGQQVSSYIVITIVLSFTIKWKPILFFSFNKIKKLFSYGKNILLSSLLETGYQNIYTLFIGKLFSRDMLGFYNKGQLFPNFITQNVNGTISSVMFPALSSQQEKKEKVKKMVRRSIVTSSFIIFPLMLGLAVVAEPLIKILLTDKWLPAVPFLQIMCFASMLYPLHTANLQAIKALGRSDLHLKLEIIKKVIGILILLVTIPFGIYVMAFFQIINSIISTFINSFPNRKLLDYKYGEQIKDILPSLVLSIVMAISIYLIKFIGLSSLVTMILQMIFGIIIYIGIAHILNMECYKYLLDALKELLKKENKNGGR